MIPGEHEEIIEDVTVSTEITETEETLENIEVKPLSKQAPKAAESETMGESVSLEPKFVYNLKDLHVKKSDEAVFELKIPTPRTKVKWLKDGKPISNSSKYQIEVILLLIVYFN
jgi:hypothetical protein